MAVKQVFETYVYDLGLSSVGPMPFVLMRVNGRHSEACGVMPQIKKCRISAGGHGTHVGGQEGQA